MSPLTPYHFSGLGPSYGKFEVGIFLPIAEKQREFGKEAIVCVSRSGYSLWT